jgi:hypothetical protein
MPPDNLRFGGGASETTIHPAVLVFMLVAMALIFLLPRKYVIWPFLSAAFLVPLGQSILVGNLHFFVIRIIILTVAVRMIASLFSSPDGVFGRQLGVFDVIFLLWAFFRALAGVLVFSFNSGALIYQAGFLLDAIGGFFVLRYLIRDDEDIYRALRAFAAICTVLAVCMVFEKVHQVNIFGLLGGVRAAPEIRNGSVRSQGPFEHEILAGTFGATLLPLFFLLWKSGKSKGLGILGAFASTVMVLTSASSTPALAYGGAVIGIAAWPLRRMMRSVRWGIVAGLIVLNMIMKAPVWFIIMHIDVVGGSSGYHRAMLVNDFIMHFRDWWLIGTADNAKWGYDMWDLCNQYVAEGQLGGLATFVCFLAMICICFSRIGRARKAVDGNLDKEWYFWLLGAALFSHIVGFFGISYFDQTRISWFALLAMILTATAAYLIKEPVKRFVRAPLGSPQPKPAYASFSALRSKTAGAPLRQHGSQLNTRFS